MTKKVGVVIVSFNRLNYLKKTLKSLDNQTYPIDKIIIFDNNSSDGTVDYLVNNNFYEFEKNKDTERNLYYASSENLGGSGGFSNAIGLAQTLDIDYIWVMDDDVCPEKDCLEILLAGMKYKNVEVAVPARYGENYQDELCIEYNLSNPFKKKKKFIKEPFDKDYYFIDDMTFEGPIMTKEISKKVGRPDDSYFIFYDDSDYARKLLEFSKILYIRNAKLERQIAQHISDDNTEFLWRDYYYNRNLLLFYKRFGKNWVYKFFGPLVLLLVQSVRILKKKNAISNFKKFLKAWVDGVVGKRGKVISPK